jgi:oligopeptide/dipeptide ABC transporter ATP-binding protein
MGAMAGPVLEIKDLSVEFRIGKRFVPAVSGVSLAVSRGKTLGIVGESGCGKSVTANAVMQLLPRRVSRISEGSVRLCGRELIGLANEELNQIRGRDVSMVFQEPMTSLNPVHTVGGQLREMLFAHEDDKNRQRADERCIRMLASVGIPAPAQRMKEYPHQLSGGMRQRVMIAMALLCRPALLIADEPTTALDVTIQAQILELIEKMREETGAAVILITHDMGVIANNCDDVAVMYAGQVVEKNTAYGIFVAPRHPYTYGLLRSVPRVDEDAETLYNIQGVVPTLEEMPAGCRFANRCEFAAAVCKERDPGLIETDGGLARCRLYQKDAPAEIARNKQRFESAVKAWFS